MKNALALIGGIVAVTSIIPYLLDIAKGKTKPNIVSWFTWTLLTSIASAAAFAAHQPRTAILTVGMSICTGLVVLLGIKYGVAKLSLFDGLCQAGAVVGLILWLILDSPSVAIACTIGIDFIVMLPTLRHAWRKPQEETWQTFLISVAACGFTLASLSDYSFASLAFPVYLIPSNLLLTSVIIYRRRQKGLRLAR